MKIYPVGAELFHVDGRTDGYDKPNSRFLQLTNLAKINIAHTNLHV
jgi:hypothetical protein